MTGKNPYSGWVERFVEALGAGEAIGTAPMVEPADASASAHAPRALLFAPHPDDEVIIGALPLRLLRERGFAVTDVAVTLGSKVERRSARWRELEAACAYVGFGLTTPDRTGLEDINLASRARDPGRWALAVDALADVLRSERPNVVFLPHAEDWNTTHVGVHHLVVEAMGRLRGFSSLVVETEYWRALPAPNLMIESSARDVAQLVAALSQHVGEVSRNPYHLRLPALMMDNVRRGGELVGGQGTDAPRFVFATLYRLRGWSEGRFHDVLDKGRFISAGDDLDGIFPKHKGA
jgi:LmbE family N-acetylglucosaminyl deacetylase